MALARLPLRLAVLVAGVALAACRAAPRDGEPLLTLRFTAEERGEVGAVGCQRGYYGGLARRTAYLRAHHARGRSLLVHGGSFLRSGMEPAELAPHVWALARAGYDAVVLGDDEVQVGVAGVRAAAARYGLPLVAANLVRAGDGAPVVAPWHLWQRGSWRGGSLRVGIVGVLGAEVGRLPAVAAQGLRVTDPLTAAAAALAAVRRAGARIVILVVHGGPELTRAAALRFGQEVDFIIAGHGGNERDLPESVGGTFVGDAGAGGGRVGEVEFHGPPDGRDRFELVVPDAARAVAELRQQRHAEIEGQLGAARARLREARGMNQTAARQVEYLERERAKLAAPRPAVAKALPRRWLSYRLRALRLDLPEDPEVRSLFSTKGR